MDNLLKTKEEYKNLKKQEDIGYIYQNKLDKACFQHDMADGDFQDFPRRTAADKVLHDKEFNIAYNPKNNVYQRRLASLVYRFSYKKSSGSGIKSEIMENQELAEELHKPIIRKFEKQKVYSSLKYKIWGANLADKQLLSKYNKGIRFCYVLLTFIVNMHELFL